MLEKENIDNLIVDDLELRNRNWLQIKEITKDYGSHKENNIKHITTLERNKWDTVEDKADSTYVDTEPAKKVVKVTGKELSTNNYATAEKNKLSGIATGAQVNTVTSVAGKTGVVSKADVTHILTFMTVDGGTTWLGMFGGNSNVSR